MQTFINHLLLKLGEDCRDAILVFRLVGCYREGMGQISIIHKRHNSLNMGESFF